MAPDKEHSQRSPRWKAPVEKFEDAVVAVLASLLAAMIFIVLAVVIYLFVINLSTVRTVANVADVQNSALDAFSGILLVLLGLELLETVKVYYREHSVRVEVILLVGLIAMGRHVLQVDLHHTDPWTMFGFSILILALAISYFLIKRTQIPAIRFRKDNGVASD